MLELRPLTHVSASLLPAVEIGETPLGLRRIVPIAGGTLRGERLSGTILPGGADFQIMRPDGVMEIHARYVVETDAGERVYVENSGLRHGPADAMERLRRGEPVDPAEIYFRTTPRFETASARLRWLTRALFAATGARHPDRVEIAIFEIL